jgi:transcriptional regulator BetI-like protein
MGRRLKKARRARRGGRARPRSQPTAHAVVSRPRPRPSPAAAIEERGLPIVRELHRIASGSGTPAVKLEGALEVLFGALGESDPQFSGLVLGGWMRARDDKTFRLTMAWLREQIRLSVEEIVVEGQAVGAFRPDLAPGPAAAVVVGAAEGCLLQTATQGGAIPPAAILQALLRLLTPAAPAGPDAGPR